MNVKMHSNDSRAQLMVGDCAIILKRFHFLQRELVLMQAGWLPGTEHWQSKLLLPEFLWQDELIAKELRERVMELRYPERRIVPGEDEPLLQLWRQFRDAPHGAAFVAVLHQAIKPAMRHAFQNYLDIADRLDDGPTIRILRQAIEDIDEQVPRWKEAHADCETAYPELQGAAAKWRQGVSDAIHGLGDSWAVSNSVKAVTDFHASEFGGRPFQISRLGKRDKRFARAMFPWPDSLDPSRGPGKGFELQIRQATHHLNEIWAAEMAGAVLFDLAEEAPAEFLEEGARWCYDESRHCRMGYTRFLKWGFTMPEMPLASFSYDSGANADPVTRLGIIYYFESTYIHTKSKRTKIFAADGDRVSSHDMDFDWADELIHSYYGTRWLKYFLEKRGEKRGPNDIKKDAERCVQKIRQLAKPADREETESLYRKTMSRASELADLRPANGVSSAKCP